METSSEKNSLKKGPWTPDEDRKLVDCIQKHGNGNWKEISKLAGLNRCGKSCRLRWANYLRPDIKRGAFSDEEEKLIIELHAKLGNKWSAIASYLPGRTDNEIKNFWNTHIKKRLLRNGIDPFTHMPRNNPSSFLPVLPQFLGCTSARSPTWENVVRFQTDAARLAKILLIGNILQSWNTGTSPHLPMEAFNLSSEPAQVTSRPPCDSRLMGLPLEGLTPKPEYNTFTCQPGLNSVPQPVFQNTTETNSFTEVYSSGIGGSSTVYTDYTVPDLVPASPECLNTDKKQNNIIIPTNVSNPSSTSTTFEALEDLMDDEANNYYWEQILDQASLSPGSISFLQKGCEWSIARD